MKKNVLPLSLVLVFFLGGCGDNGGDPQVISKRYVHKYGYAVSQSEWDANHYPGQVITNLRSGVTMTATYENGILHGPCTHTHPHSQTVQYFSLYNFGELKKEVTYDSLGMPIQERVQLSPQRYCVTKWYVDGNPMSIEDFAGEELIDGQYLTLNNEIQSRVERGIGVRVQRDQHGLLLSKDYFDAGYLVKCESFYPTGQIESVSYYTFNKRNGERRVLTEKGEPLAFEEWVGDQLHGKASYYAHGKKQIDVYFINGARNGLETHYIDGETVEQEIHWIHDKRHGPTKFYVNGAVAKTEWYYDGKQISKRRFDELDQMDQMITNSSAAFNESAIR